MRSVVVTGTSTGIGWGTTKVLIARGFRVFGSVRKKADAERLSAEFGAAFVPLVFDVTDEDAVGSAAARVGDALAGEKLFGLVNNAGVAVAGPLLELPLNEFRHQIDINLTGVVITTKAFGPLLGTDRALKGPPGRIVNISSVGGKNAVPFLSPYAASKFALEGLSEGLRRELLPFGIDVIVVAPGAVATAIWAKAEQVDITPYLDTPYAAALERMRSVMLGLGKKGLPPEQRIGEGAARSDGGTAVRALHRNAAAAAGFPGARSAEAHRRPPHRRAIGALAADQRPRVVLTTYRSVGSKFVDVFPLDFAESLSQRPVCARDIGPHPEADRLFSVSLVRVHQVPVAVIGDPGPDLVHQCFHGRTLRRRTAFDVTSELEWRL